jgi:RNA polymerase sigma-B factor
MSAHTTRQDNEIRRETAWLLAELGSCTREEQRRHLRHRLVVVNIPVATNIAMRYRSRGAGLEDLLQAANLGLVKAVHGFDPGRTSDFMAYAVPTISGEVKRYFRDQGWDIRPPRRVQELRPAVHRVSAALTQALGRSPRLDEIAEHLQVAQEDVVECVCSAEIYTVNSLDAAIGGEELAVAEVLGEPDPAMAKIEDLMTLKTLLEDLSARDRRILALRFFQDWTQQQIARDIGVTQMQVSRLLTKALARLRAGMTAA